MIIKIITLFGDMILKFVSTDIFIGTWIPLIIGICCFRFMYMLMGKRD